MIRAKCIGGPKDGEVVAALHGDKLLFVAPADFSPSGPGVEIAPKRSQAEYRRETIHTDAGSVDLWVWSELSPLEAVAALVARYAAVADPQRSATPAALPDTP